MSFSIKSILTGIKHGDKALIDRLQIQFQFLSILHIEELLIIWRLLSCYEKMIISPDFLIYNFNFVNEFDEVNFVSRNPG